MNAPEILKYLKNPSLLSGSSLPALEEMVKEYPWFQAGWFLYLKNLLVLGDPRFQEALEQGALQITDRRELKRFLFPPEPSERGAGSLREEDLPAASYLLEEKENEAGGVTLHPERVELINDFLAAGASFKGMTPAKEETPAAPPAENEDTLSEGIVSETYANLLLSQGKYDKAVQAFEYLCLKFPEKSIYFAARKEEAREKAGQT